ncbi:MAG TPA: hypothetical protein VK911_16630, partial [Vicinamibacterales bacterium]|nr:hypothetical protein [Vicinamibacterales bacterium]
SRLIRDLGERAAATGERPAIGMHYEMRRPVEWALRDPAAWPQRLSCPPGQGVPCVLRYLEAGGRPPIWFLANPRRTDLAQIDRRAIREVGRYDWQFEAEALTGNPRPNEAVWYELSAPGWFVGAGWALTPELAGRSAALGKGPSVGPITARVRRRPGAAVAILGGRHLGGAPSAPGRVEATIDGRPLVSFEVARDQQFFLRTIALPPGSLTGAGPFATLSITADGGGPIAIEQFDLQDDGDVVFGFAEGWYEPEHDPGCGTSWRWASDRAQLQVHDGGADVTVSVSVESPRRYFDRAPLVTLSAGGRTLAHARPEGDFTLTARVPAAALRGANGLITLATDLSYVPAIRGENPDQRRLGLRVYSVSVGRALDERPGSAAGSR